MPKEEVFPKTCVDIHGQSSRNPRETGPLCCLRPAHRLDDRK